MKNVLSKKPNYKQEFFDFIEDKVETEVKKMKAPYTNLPSLYYDLCESDKLYLASLLALSEDRYSRGEWMSETNNDMSFPLELYFYEGKNDPLEDYKKQIIDYYAEDIENYLTNELEHLLLERGLIPDEQEQLRQEDLLNRIIDINSRK